MTYPYGSRLNATVGGGLGGLPRRVAAADTSGLGGIMAGAPVLNEWRSGYLEDGAISGPHTLPFDIVDARRVFLQVRMVPSTSFANGGFPMEVVTFYDDTYIGTNKVYDLTANSAGFSWTVTDGSDSLVFTPENLKAVEIYLVEYDVDVVSNQTANFLTTGTSVTLTTPIADATKTYLAAGERSYYQQHWHPVWHLDEFSTTNVAAWGNGSNNYAFRVPASDTVEKAFTQNSLDNLYVIVREYTW